MKFLKILCAAVFSVLVVCSGAFAKAKVALVIGNGSYKHAVELPNPLRDAELMGETLRGAGFEIISGNNLDKDAMGDLIDTFIESAYDAELAVVYYAGHGMQVDGKNYLIPVDAELTSPAHLRTRAIDLTDLIAALPSDPGVGVVILDACRDNPLARTLASRSPTRSISVGSGLAPVQAESGKHGTGGVLIAYATDPGSIALDGKGTHSPYTKALAKHIAEPGLELQSALTRVRGEVTSATLGRQRPWHNASLGKEVFIGGTQPKLVIAPVGTSNSQTMAPAVTVSKIQVEKTFWDEVTKRDTAAYYQAYLDQYPTGRFSSIAKLNLKHGPAAAASKQVASLENNPDTVVEASAPRMALSIPDAVRKIPGTPQTEKGIGLNREQRKDLQLRLTALGHDTKGVDGSLGNNSRTAIGGWQTAHAIVATTYLTAAQWGILKIESDPLMPAVRANRQRALAVQRSQRKTTKRRVTKRKKARRSARRTTRKRGRKKRRGISKGGAFAAGVVTGVVGCKLLNC